MTDFKEGFSDVEAGVGMLNGLIGALDAIDFQDSEDAQDQRSCLILVVKEYSQRIVSKMEVLEKQLKSLQTGRV